MHSTVFRAKRRSLFLHTRYDGLNQLISTNRGQLTLSPTPTISSPTFSQDWNLDGLGNWSGFDDNGTAQTRTANAANEITAASGWVTPAYDAAGNMTTIPSPQSGNALHATQAKYDAWNRLVEVTDGGILVAKFSYDATGRRILQLLDSNSPGSPDGLDKSIDYYLNGQQVVETREGALVSGVHAAPETLDPTHQFIWSLRYIDALVCRDDFSGGIIQPDARLFYLNDANYNVTALVGKASGAWQIVERYVYNPYGETTIYVPDWSSLRTASNYGNVNLYSGREFDYATWLFYNRARYFNPHTGTFTARDEIESDVSLYRYCKDNPTGSVDPTGWAMDSVDGGFSGLIAKGDIDSVILLAKQLGLPAAKTLVLVGMAAATWSGAAGTYAWSVAEASILAKLGSKTNWCDQYEKGSSDYCDCLVKAYNKIQSYPTPTMTSSYINANVPHANLFVKAVAMAAFNAARQAAATAVHALYTAWCRYWYCPWTWWTFQ